MSDTKLVNIAPGGTGPRFAALPHEDFIEVMGVIAGYGRFYDDDRVDDFMNLIAEDAVFYPNWPGVAPEEVSGHAALREFFAGARVQARENNIQPRHYATNVIFTKAGGVSVEATISMLYAESKPGGEVALKMVGQYDFIIAKRNGRWFITRWSMRYDK